MKILTKTLTFIFILLSSTSNQSFSQDWKSILEERLPLYGHRNWIIIADAAYPKQSAPGIETIYTGAGQLEVLNEVLKQIDASKHIQPIIMHDTELDFVKEDKAPGIDEYRKELKKLLANYNPKVMLHEDIIAKLDKSSKMFNILLLKTDMTIPYTSVFIELDCGYWGAEKEKELRELMKKN
jgi:L-fucose mutarotase/ribose pyranase (RbsD/FucU family)